MSGLCHFSREVQRMTQFVARADRVQLWIPITYRIAGHQEWLESRIVNISDSGVLIGPATIEPEPGTPVEVVFSSPVQVGSMAPGKLRCVGEVIRTTEAGELGARFEECRFLLEA
jgi:hypothetical protein